jgi:hypothetical protein
MDELKVAFEKKANGRIKFRVLWMQNMLEEVRISSLVNRYVCK